MSQCGYFGPNHVFVTDIQLRDAIRQVAEDERRNWFDSEGNAYFEWEDSQFGRLVDYWLGRYSAIGPTTLTAMQLTATSSSINYGRLLDEHASQDAIDVEVQRLRAELLSGAPDQAMPPDLARLVEHSFRSSRYSRYNHSNLGPWSAVFISSCIRRAAICLGLEGLQDSIHVGREGLLLSHDSHRIYVREAYLRRFGTTGQQGTYHAFRIDERTPQVGDLIVQDRTANSIDRVVAFDEIPIKLATGYGLHSDVIVEVTGDYAIAIGGNVANCCRRRRFPRDGENGHLVVDQGQLYTQESNSGNLPHVPEVDSGPDFHARSTGRIFTILGLVERCVETA